ncbi:MAG: 50S ribosomal protein L24 [Candidatus Vogelbacteria bacterium]|nr:50S ribosomal protein L24 [Candidatus Vogelbacteria bacterium]
MKLKKGDNVIIRAGKDRRREGKILRVFPARTSRTSFGSGGPRGNKVVVEGINLLKRRIRPKKAGEKGQVVTVAYPLAAAKVMIKCVRCGRGVRVGYRLEGLKKLRICRKCGASI